MFAAAEARRRHASLQLVHGYVVAVPDPAYSRTQQRALADAIREDARRVLSDMELRTHAASPNLTIRSTLVAGGAASTLVELSRGAGLVVVGSRGGGRSSRLLLGSVATQVAAYAHAPVIVARTVLADGPRAPVVVGVDGSGGSELAVGFAFDVAHARSAPLVAINAWWMQPRRGHGRISLWDVDPLLARSEAERLLAEALAGWSAKFPDVDVRRMARHEVNPALALVEASGDAAMVVVGCRGRGGFASMLLGSVSRAVLTHAHCPVAVVREAEE